MNIAEKLRDSIENATGRPFIYDTLEGLNVEIGRLNTARVVFAQLFDTGSLREENGQYFERVNAVLFFCDKMAGHDCFTMQNEAVLDECKKDALTWLTKARTGEDLRVVSLNGTARSYEELDDIITAYVLNVTIEETAGFGACDITKQPNKWPIRR